MTTDLASLGVPGPTATELSGPFWQAAALGRLAIQRCVACTKAVFYPRAICPHCWADALDWRDASGKGRLKSFSVIWKPGHPGWIAATPYVVGLVELAEGPTMLSLILAPADRLAVGDPLRFVPTNIGGRILPCFASEEPQGEKAMTEKSNRDGWAGVIKGKPQVGQSAERSRTTSMQDIVSFTDMTGDRNPVHYDEVLAKKTSFGKLIVQGGVTTGILNACVAEDLPGPGTVFLNTTMNFKKAVGVGETITGRVEVMSTRDDKPICTLHVSVRDSTGEVCVEGTAVTYTMPLQGL